MLDAHKLNKKTGERSFDAGWSIRPGEIVLNAESGKCDSIKFPGTEEEWYCTLWSTIKDLAKDKKYIFASPDVCTILENMVYFRPNDEGSHFCPPTFAKKVGTIFHCEVVSCFVLYTEVLVLAKDENLEEEFNKVRIKLR